MTVQSLNARLKKCDPALRIRTRTGWIIMKAEGFAMIGVYRGATYLNVAGIAGDIPYETRPTLFRVERIPGMTKPLTYIHSRMRRGRRTIIKQLEGHRGIRYRWQKQLLKI